MKRRAANFIFALILLGVLAMGAWAWLTQVGIKPVEGKRSPVYVRFEKQSTLRVALAKLEEEKLIRSASLVSLYAKFQGIDLNVREGTYEFKDGLTVDEIFKALKKPMLQMVRLPEGYWLARTAKVLEEKGVAKADDYLELAKKPGEFKDVVDFPLPKDSLEGYLYPDTYDLPPMLGARGVIIRQLQAFEKKVWEGLDKPKNLDRAVTIAAMVQLEVAIGTERPTVAGVIENRLAQNMPLQIDATINYALQEWRPLTVAEYKSVQSPYNTYRQQGLPPGPICSPSVASIKAALAPQSHGYIYYVALPDRRHLFSTTYAQHLANIQKRRQALKEAS